MWEYFCNGCGLNPDWVAVLSLNALNGRAKVSPALVSNMLALPEEIVLLILEEMPLAEAVRLIKHTVNSYDSIHARKLQCFCFKKSYLDAKLGNRDRHRGWLQSGPEH